jgi:glycosyltransferase involved in cell wall biosynthesis
MRILIVITYYRPHTSGLTIYAERLARAWVKRGHQVTVLTSQFDKSFPLDEICDGVRVLRIPVLFRVSKGVIMPSFGLMASRLVLEHDVVQLHLPQFDAAGVALRGRLFKRPTIITYHCDLRMPPGLINWAANQAVLWMNELAALFTHRMVTYTQDYADHSAYLRRHLKKLTVIPPPVELPSVTPEQVKQAGMQYNPDARMPVIGMAARFATEKGVEVLLDALPAVLEKYPNAMVQFAGPYENIIGEEAYIARLLPRIRQYEATGHWKFLGNLNPHEMARFYPNLNVFVVPSLNSTEAFGLVQIEAMLNGVPCVASSLPGVRQPVLIHKMGRIFPIGSSVEMANCLLDVLGNPEQFKGDKKEIQDRYLPESIAIEYEKLFSEMIQHT